MEQKIKNFDRRYEIRDKDDNLIEWIECKRHLVDETQEPIFEIDVTVNKKPEHQFTFIY